MRTIKKQLTQNIPAPILSAILILTFISSSAQDSTGAFGDSIPISNGFMGRLYLLKEGIDSLPRFDTMEPAGLPMYVATLNIPDRNWSDGFPGLRQRNEWFGLDYKGTFKVNKMGQYQFRLVSDDGARLYIGNHILIDEDGTHPSYSKAGTITLDRDSTYPIEVQYYQGPRYRLALQLFWTKAGDSTERIFPGPGTIFVAAAPARFPWWVLGVILAALAAAGWLIIKRRNKKSRQ